jgi:hypothetical protein
MLNPDLLLKKYQLLLMLNSLEIYTTNQNKLWFAAQDCAKILKIDAGSLVRRKTLQSKLFIIKGKKKRFIKEEQFKLLFKSNGQLLKELEQYKADGTIATTQQTAYSNLLTVAYFYICADASSPNLELEGVPALPKSIISKNLHRKEVALALLQVYLNVLFNDKAITPPDLVLRYEVFKAFPNQVDTEMLKDIFYGDLVPASLIKKLTQATRLDTTLLREALKFKLKRTEVAEAAKACISAAATDVHSVYGLPNMQGNDKPKLALYHFLYPRTLEVMPLDLVSEILYS